MSTELENRLDQAESIADLQERVDAAEAVAPLSRLGRLVVGTWLAVAAQLIVWGGVAPGDLAAVTLGLLAVCGWGYVLVGGTRFLLARRELRRLRGDLAPPP